MPHACLGGVADSLPPQCGDGVPLAGWDWAAAGTYETSGEVRWGVYVLTGTFDGTALTVTDADRRRRPASRRPVAFVTPCPEPAAGWVPSDPERSGGAVVRRSCRRMAQHA